jgi:hypothetical protein
MKPVETFEQPAAHPRSGGGMITHRVNESGFGATEHDPDKVRRAIYQAESLMAQLGPIDLIPAEHMFVPNLYFRKFEMEAETFLTGKIHAQDDGLIVASGTVSFLTEDGFRTITGPCMTVVKGGVKPLLYASTHVVFFSAHLNLDDTQDLALIESRVVTPNVLGCEPKKELL